MKIIWRETKKTDCNLHKGNNEKAEQNYKTSI